MAWEKRGKARYYYRGVRGDDGRVVKEYLGSGKQAQRAARQDEAARSARQREREQLREIIEAMASACDVMQELERGATMLYQGTLLAAGFHTHRGTWRKRRG